MQRGILPQQQQMLNALNHLKRPQTAVKTQSAPPISQQQPHFNYETMNLNDAVPTVEALEVQYAGDTDKLCTEHEKLIEQILEEEEELITGHRRHIDEVVDLVKQEMSLLNDVDKPGSDVENYVANLDKLLTQKISMITEMRKQLIMFHTHLKTEEVMSKLYQQQQQQLAQTSASTNNFNNGALNFMDEMMMENNNYQAQDDGSAYYGEVNQDQHQDMLLQINQMEENAYGDEDMLLNDDGTNMQDLMGEDGGVSEDQYFYNNQQ